MQGLRVQKILLVILATYIYTITTDVKYVVVRLYTERLQPNSPNVVMLNQEFYNITQLFLNHVVVRLY